MWSGHVHDTAALLLDRLLGLLQFASASATAIHRVAAQRVLYVRRRPHRDHLVVGSLSHLPTVIA